MFYEAIVGIVLVAGGWFAGAQAKRTDEFWRGFSQGVRKGVDVARTDLERAYEDMEKKLQGYRAITERAADQDAYICYLYHYPQQQIINAAQERDDA